jgi:hypothetical protein
MQRDVGVREDGGVSVVLASSLQGICRVGKDMLRLFPCRLDYAHDKHKDQGEYHGVLYEGLAALACAKLIDFSHQCVVSSLVCRDESRAGSEDRSA